VCREYLKQKKIKQIDFAQLCGLGKERISAIVGTNPKFLVSLNVVDRLAAGMNTTVDWLINGPGLLPPAKGEELKPQLSEVEERLLMVARAVSSSDDDPSELSTAMKRLVGLAVQPGPIDPYENKRRDKVSRRSS
jgi:transcriptional regulator with XRE-family HTH domain